MKELCYSVLQCVAVCYSVLQSVAECCSVLQCVAVSCPSWKRCVSGKSACHLPKERGGGRGVVTCLIHKRDTTYLYQVLSKAAMKIWREPLTHHSHVWQDSFVCSASYVRHDVFQSCSIWHDEFICASWLIPTCAMTHPFSFESGVFYWQLIWGGYD